MGKKNKNSASQTPGVKTLQVKTKVGGKKKKSKASGGLGRLQMAPLAQARSSRTGAPSISVSMSPSGDGRIRIKHREFIQDVPGSVAFSAQSLSVNPGLAELFVWLNQIAANYESYLAIDLAFVYETEKSASTNGSLMLAMDFDAADAAPTSKQALMSFHNAVRSAVWQECKYVCDRQDLQKFGARRYVRLGNVAANLDIKTYDVGNLIIATQGCADTSAIGELYVEYTIELETPQTNMSAIIAALSVALTGAGSVSKTAYLGTAPTSVGGLNVVAGTNTLTFNRVGQWLLEVETFGTVLIAPTQTGTAAVTALSVAVVNAAATLSVNSFLVNVTALGQTVILDYSGSGTITSSVSRIAAYATANA